MSSREERADEWVDGSVTFKKRTKEKIKNLKKMSQLLLIGNAHYSGDSRSDRFRSSFQHLEGGATQASKSSVS